MPYEATSTPYGDVARGVLAEGLGKRFGDLWALARLDLDVPAGLGARPARPQRRRQDDRDPHPHHARRARPTARAQVAGHDVVAEPRAVRARIGLAGQAATVDGLLTARAQPRAGRPALPPAPRRRPPARRRAARAARAGRRRRPARQDVLRRHAPPARPRRQRWSPRRRCCSSTSRPPGSTPRAATSCGSCCASSSRDGTTLVLTTQYLEEADRLADNIVVLDHGRVDRHRHARPS